MTLQDVVKYGFETSSGNRAEFVVVATSRVISPSRAVLTVRFFFEPTAEDEVEVQAFLGGLEDVIPDGKTCSRDKAARYLATGQQCCPLSN